MKIKPKLQIVGILPFAFALMIGLIIFLTSQQLNEAEKKVKASDAIIHEVFELNILTYEYLQYHEERMQTQWQLKHAALKRFLTGAEFEKPEEQVIFDRIRSNNEDLVSLFSQLVANYERKKFSREETSISLEWEARLAGQLLVNSQAMVSDASHLHELSHTEVMSIQQRTDLLVMVSIAIMALLMGTTSFLIGRSIEKPITNLHKATEIIAGGNLDYKTNIRTPDEIGQLSNAFDAMTENLKKITVSRDKLNEEIEERIKIEKQLSISEERFRIAAKSATDLIWDWDILQGKLEWFGDIDKMLGYAPGKFPRTIQAWEKAIHPDDHDRVMTALEWHLNTQALYSEEYHMILKDGGLRYWTDRGTAMRDEKGNAYRMIGVCSDITELKQAEEDLRKLNAELEQRVVERTAQLEATNKELGAFSYSVSHDLRAPLRHLMGFVELLKKSAPESIDEKNRHYLNVISDSSKQMGKLIDDLLSFSQMGRVEMMKTKVNLDQLVKEAIKEFQTEITGRDIAWKIDKLFEVNGDPVMLRLALINLILNALKFTRPRAHAKIEIGCSSGNENESVFYIKDNGVGFDMRYADKLFVLFQRLHRSEEFEGTGVGLANVRRIIHRHSGRTWAEGSVDGGATFYFTLPKLKEG